MLKIEVEPNPVMVAFTTIGIEIKLATVVVAVEDSNFLLGVDYLEKVVEAATIRQEFHFLASGVPSAA